MGKFNFFVHRKVSIVGVKTRLPGLMVNISVLKIDRWEVLM